MKNDLFFIEVSNNINVDDFTHLRRLYLPIVGLTSTTFYEYIIDLSKDNQQNMFNIEEIAKHFQVTSVEISNAVINLEAVGLLKKYIKSDNSVLILELNKPLNVEKFNKNSLLKNHLIKKIGIHSYESIIFGQRSKTINKSDFIDITKKYQDVYLDNFNDEISNQTSDSYYSTLELNVKFYDNHDENIEKLSSSHFIKYLLKRNPSFNEIQLINTLLKLGFSDASINVLFDYSFKFNEKIVCPYVLKIAQDFNYRSIKSFNEVRHEIAIVQESKARKNNNFDFYKTNEIVIDNKITESQEGYISSTKEISINEIFSDEDMKEMF